MTEIVPIESDQSLLCRITMADAEQVVIQDAVISKCPCKASSGSWLAPAVALAAIGWGATQFAPLIVLYRQHGVSASATEIMFGLYAVGLVPALFVGGRWSDRAGRKAVVTVALALSLLASLVMLMGSASAGWLYVGRLVAGIGSGLAFGTGAAWIRELSSGLVHAHAGPRR